MSSPSHRRQRSSVSGTPKRSSRRSSQPIPSSPADDPAAAQLLGEAASSQRGQTSPRTRGPVASSSPLNFRSSPAPLIGDVFSPLGQVHNSDAMTDDGGMTPRASGNMLGGKSICLVLSLTF